MPFTIVQHGILLIFPNTLLFGLKGPFFPNLNHLGIIKRTIIVIANRLWTLQDCQIQNGLDYNRMVNCAGNR